MDTYIEQLEELSLTARVAIALKLFDLYCSKNHIIHPKINEFIDYLWQWPLIDGPNKFGPWESSRPHLVNFGLGDELDSELLILLESLGKSERSFRVIISSIVEILWGSFWGRSENRQSLSSLKCVIKMTESPLPNLTPFKFSKFLDGGGWGNRLTKEDVLYWRIFVNCI